MAKAVQRLAGFGVWLGLVVVPLLAFIVITFVVPIADMLYRSVDNPRLATLMPETMAELQAWDGNDLPPEAVFASLVKEIVADGFHF